jgi:uncharacterized membrane protein
MTHDTYLRTFTKSISWRLSASLATVILVFAFTSKIELAATIGGVELVLKFFLYYVHERIWNLIPFGQVE